MLRLLVGTRFQVLFHSAPAVLFTFPSRYLCTIGRQGVFSLRRWSSRIPTGFLVSRSTRGLFPPSCVRFGYRALTVYGRPSQTVLLHTHSGWLPCSSPQTAPQPRTRNGCSLSHASGLGSSAFARHYSRNRVCFLFLGVLRCFTSPGSPLEAFRPQAAGASRQRVPPFGHPRLKACLRLPVAFRRSPRPSSALGA